MNSDEFPCEGGRFAPSAARTTDTSATTAPSSVMEKDCTSRDAE